MGVVRGERRIRLISTSDAAFLPAVSSHDIILGVMVLDGIEDQEPVRWAIGSPVGRRGAVWRLWSNRKGDFYLATRSLGHILKTSLHRDGNCHTGYTKSYFDSIKASIQTDLRHWDRWSLPNAALVQALKIVVPAQELRAFQSTNDDDQIKWIEAPQNDYLTVVSIFVEQMGHVTETWPGVSQGTKLIGNVRTSTRAAWVVYTQHPIDNSTRIDIDKYRAMIMARIPPDKVQGKVGLRTILLGFRDGNERFMVEVALE